MIHTHWETIQARVNSAKSALNVLICLCFIILDVCQEKFQDPARANYVNSATLRYNLWRTKFFKYFKFIVLSAWILHQIMQKSFCPFLWLCILHCAMLGNIVRWYVSSLLGSYVQQEYYVAVIQMWQAALGSQSPFILGLIEVTVLCYKLHLC